MMNRLFEAKQALVNTSLWLAFRDFIFSWPDFVTSQRKSTL